MVDEDEEDYDDDDDLQEVDTEVEDDLSDADVEELELAITNTEETRSPDRRIHALSSDDKALCIHIVTKGPDYLRFELGWKAQKTTDFLGRVAVQAECEYLRKAYEQREGLQERTQFFSQLQLNRMVPRSLQILGQSLLGDRIDENDGTITRGPSRSQFDAALQVLDRSGIILGAKFKGDDSIPKVDARSITVNLGIEEGDRSTGQKLDNVRNFMDRLVDHAEKGRSNGKKRRRRRRGTKKKATKEEQ